MKGRFFIAMRWIVSALFILLALYFIAPGSGKKETLHFNLYNPQAFEESTASGNPTMVYFTADWCVPCRELKLFTFSDEGVMESVEEKKYTAYVIDLTTLEPEDKTAKEFFNIKGVPTVILYNGDGAEIKRFTGFIPPEEFLSIL
jgi:thiol:disulfide interchange protein DsbD